jgi:nitroreductase
VLGCLNEANQAWARQAGALALGVVSQRFALNGKPNKAAFHDLGLAAANLSLEATARGLHVHQMIGILPDRAREEFSIPEGYEPLTGLAIGYAATLDGAPEALRSRDATPRERRPLAEFLFGAAWGEPASLLRD